MTNVDIERNSSRIRAAAWGATAALVLLPLFALRMADPAAWDIADLPFAFVMIAAVGIAFEFALRVPVRWVRTAGTVAALATAFILVWGNLAVGFAGSEDNRVNIIFFAVPVGALVGSLVSRFRPSGVAMALTAAAVAQILCGVVALAEGYFTGPLTISFAGLWLASALLFARSAARLPELVKEATAPR
ncbi:MAG TPA: hypothetical protein VIL42_05055 [Sphingomicrobium sp.]|jgi:hypothetical protein